MAKKVTFEAFLALPKYEKFDVIFTIGNFIDSRTEGKKQVILYSFDQFFVELYFDPRVNKIVKVNSFVTGGERT